LAVLIDVLLFVGGVAFGILAFIAYIVMRMLRADGWDDSNVLNAFRVLAYVMIHPDELGGLQDSVGEYPFWYINRDEFRDIV